MNPNAEPFKPTYNYKYPSNSGGYSTNNYVSNNSSGYQASHSQMQNYSTETFQRQNFQDPVYYTSNDSYLTNGNLMNYPLNVDYQQNMMSSLSSNQQQQPTQTTPLSTELIDKMYSSSNPVALFEVQIGLEQIVYEGHEYETWANAIRDRLTNADVNNEVLTTAIDIIIEMAVLFNDCQYNFSKLCEFLNRYVQNFATNHLIPELNEFAFQHNNYSNFVNLTHQEIHNFVLFLAELYEKIEINGGRMLQLAALIIEHLKVLLKFEPTHDAIVKSVIKVLKLVGRYLETDQGTLAMQGIFELLRKVCYNSKELSENVKDQVLALNQLRENNWGVSEQATSSSTKDNLGNGTTGTLDSMFIVGPDGKPLTEEECAFLEENCEFGTSPSGSWNGLVMDDDEVLEDYEKFLQATAIRAAEKALEKMSFEEEDFEHIGNTSGKIDQIPLKSHSTQSKSLSDKLVIVRKEKRHNDSNGTGNCKEK